MAAKAKKAGKKHATVKSAKKVGEVKPLSVSLNFSRPSVTYSPQTK